MASLRGIILAGGKGTRMLPATRVMNKHMIPVLNIPMIEYPLKTLIGMGIKEIMVVSGGNHIGQIAEYLGDGSDYGVSLTYRVQKEAGGIAQALLLAEGFVDGQFAVILGDNYFDELPKVLPRGMAIITKKVRNPQRFGVLSGSKITEKPKKPKSNLAVTGLYFYTQEVFEYIKTLKPSKRGELEITDLNNWCLKQCAIVLEHKGFWSDMGTPESMLDTIKFITKK